MLLLISKCHFPSQWYYTPTLKTCIVFRIQVYLGAEEYLAHERVITLRSIFFFCFVFHIQLTELLSSARSLKRRHVEYQHLIADAKFVLITLLVLTVIYCMTASFH